MENEYIVVSGIIFLAALTQSITGFGFAIVSMSFLPQVIGLQTAVPLVALVGVILNSIIWLYHRHDCNYKVARRLIVAASIATPIGTVLLDRFPEAIALRGLGILIVSYTAYDCLNLTVPKLKSESWTYLAGGLSGILSGAYAVGGPPLIVYANCRLWAANEFKGNLTPVFCLSALLASISHGWQGNITLSVGRLGICSLPGFACGLWLGTTLAKKMNPLVVRRITLALLLIAGLKLLI